MSVAAYSEDGERWREMVRDGERWREDDSPASPVSSPQVVDSSEDKEKTGSKDLWSTGDFPPAQVKTEIKSMDKRIYDVEKAKDKIVEHDEETIDRRIKEYLKKNASHPAAAA